ncbi:MAG: AAA family ATPase [Desulfatibacillaceae bacterium]|nr:AAA family ATPase [Desulfatibacillaceae bacterium]
MEKRPFFLKAEWIEPEVAEGSLVVRTQECQALLSLIAEIPPQAKRRHVFLYGPQGSGKTLVLNNLAGALLAKPGLCVLNLKGLLHLVRDAASFLRLCLARIEGLLKPGQPQPGAQAPGLNNVAEALASFCEGQQKRIIVFLDDFEPLFTQYLPARELGRLFLAIQKVPGLVLVGSSRQPINDEPDFAFSSHFTGFRLGPLLPDESPALWKHCQGSPMPGGYLRPLAILTGNLPGPLWAAGSSFDGKSLASVLKGLCTSHAPAIDSEAAALPPAERRIYLALADLWDPASAADIAAITGDTVNFASALCARLVLRGLVATRAKTGRQKLYELTHRGANLARIYFGPDIAARSRLVGLTEFMEAWYALDKARLTPAKPAQKKPARPKPPQTVLPECGYLKSIAQEEPPVSSNAVSVDAPSPRPSPLPLETAADKACSIYLALCPPLSGEGALLGESLEEATVLEPENSLAWGFWGAFLYGRGDFERAEDAFLKSIELDAGNCWVWLHLGALMMETVGRAVDAEQAFRIALSLEPDNFYAFALLGRLLADKPGQEALAEKAILKALDLNPGFAAVHALLGEFLSRRTERQAQAEQATQKAISLNPVYPAVWDLCILALQRLPDGQQKAEQAARACKLLLESQPPPEAGPAGKTDALPPAPAPPDKTSQFDFGQILEAEQNAAKRGQAILLLNEEVQKNPDNAWAASRLGVLLGHDASCLDEANKALQRANALLPNDAFTLAGLGWVHHLLGRPEEALAFYQKAVQSQDAGAFAWFYKGVLFAGELKDSVRAEECFRQAFALEPDGPWAYAHLGDLLLQDQDRAADARKALARALDLDPKYAFALGAMARWESRYGDKNKAWQAFQEAVMHAPECLDAWEELIEFAANTLNDQGAAQAYARQCIERAKNPRDAIGRIKALFVRHNWPGLPVEFVDSLPEPPPGQGSHTAQHDGPLQKPAAQDLWPQAIKENAIWFEDVQRIRENLFCAVSFLFEAIKAGFAKEAKPLMQGAACRHLFEPLAAAVDGMKAKPALVALEIFQVASDIVGALDEKA